MGVEKRNFLLFSCRSVAIFGWSVLMLRALGLICQMPDWFGLLAVGCGSSSVFHAL